MLGKKLWQNAILQEKKDQKTLQQRYFNIRTTFGRYLGKLKAPSESERDEISLKPQWEHLRWLITHIEHRNTKLQLQRSNNIIRN